MSDNSEADALIRSCFASSDLLRAVFAGPRRNDRNSRWLRATVRVLTIDRDRHFQFEYFDGRQAIARNVADPFVSLEELLAIGFAHIHLFSDREEIEIRTSKKGKVLISRRAIESQVLPLVHNRVKDHPLPEGKPNRLLETMGIATADGRIRASHRDKFVQINEFLKLFVHALESLGMNSADRPLSILDAGCGSSYLTLALHYYLNTHLKRPATILGVDVNDAVIRKSVARADSLGASGLSFTCGSIGSIEAKADIVVALHACDTATDDALSQAVRSDAKLIMSVPCCHKHLNRQLKTAGPTDVLRSVYRHGILRERMADILTDSFRALALRILGYRTEVVEFVNLEHTARNVMIRAVRIPDGDVMDLIEEYRTMKRFWRVAPYLESVFGDRFRSFVG